MPLSGNWHNFQSWLAELGLHGMRCERASGAFPQVPKRDLDLNNPRHPGNPPDQDRHQPAQRESTREDKDELQQSRQRDGDHGVPKPAYEDEMNQEYPVGVSGQALKELHARVDKPNENPHKGKARRGTRDREERQRGNPCPALQPLVPVLRQRTAHSGLQCERVCKKRQQGPSCPQTPSPGQLAIRRHQSALQPPCACPDPGKEVSEVHQDAARLKPKWPPPCPVKRPNDQCQREINSSRHQDQPPDESRWMFRGPARQPAKRFAPFRSQPTQPHGDAVEDQQHP